MSKRKVWWMVECTWFGSPRVEIFRSRAAARLFKATLKQDDECENLRGPVRLVESEGER